MRETLDCGQFEGMAVLYAAGELADENRAAVETHARECATCAAKLSDELDLYRAVVSSEQAADALDRSGLLLARCRSELSEALDDADARRRSGWRELLLPSRWAADLRRAVVFHPAWSAVLLLILGAFCGFAARKWYQQDDLVPPERPGVTVPAPPAFDPRELANTRVEGIRVDSPQGSEVPQVEVQMRAERPMVLKGSPDDADIREVLSYVLEHGQRYDPRVRLDSLDVLRTRTADPQVRATLSDALRHDEDRTVRIKALEALRGTGQDPTVRRAMLNALSRDHDSDVRRKALDALLAGFEGGDSSPVSVDQDAIDILRDRMHNDDDRDIRSRSASALGRLVSATPHTPLR